MTSECYPERWNHGRLATLFVENTNKNSSLNSVEALKFCFGEIAAKPVYELTDDLKETYRKYTVIMPDDIIINGLNLNYDFVTQRVARVKTNGIITSAYICLRPREGVFSKYYSYLFKAMDAKKIFNGMGTGIRLTLSYNLFKNMILPIPPHDEQIQIASYLDWKVSEINKLIAAKKKQIQLLEELKLKRVDSIFLQIEENREGPIAPIGRYIKSIESGTSVNSEYGSAEAEEYGVLATSCVYGNVFRISENKKVSLRDYSRVKCPVKSDVVIVSRMNTPQLVGACGYSGVSHGNIFLPDRLWQISFDKHVLPQYAWRYLSSRKVQMWFATIATGSSSTMKNITKPQLKAVLLPCPNINVQQDVIDKIDSISSYYLEVETIIADQIKNLLELKIRLISNTVTGQIDVCNIVIPDFEYVEEVSDESYEDGEEFVDDEPLDKGGDH